MTAGQLEAALAAAQQRIAELVAQVTCLTAKVQQLEEQLAAAATQVGTLQVSIAA